MKVLLIGAMLGLIAVNSDAAVTPQRAVALAKQACLKSKYGWLMTAHPQMAHWKAQRVDRTWRVIWAGPKDTWDCARLNVHIDAMTGKPLTPFGDSETCAACVADPF